MGFMPTRYDQDVWYQLRGDGEGYDYILIYVDDFMITAKDAWSYMAKLQAIYTIKGPKEPDMYLGALCTGSLDKYWTISCKICIKEGLSCIEQMAGIPYERRRCQP